MGGCICLHRYRGNTEGAGHMFTQVQGQYGGAGGHMFIQVQGQYGGAGGICLHKYRGNTEGGGGGWGLHMFIQVQGKQRSGGRGRVRGGTIHLYTYRGSRGLGDGEKGWAIYFFVYLYVYALCIYLFVYPALIS